MIAPAIVFLLLVMVYPLFDIFRLSLFEFAGLRAQTATFVGLKNFGSLLQDRIYWISMKNTLIFVLGSVVFHALVGGIFALILNQHWPNIWLRNLVRGLLILPWLFSLAAAGLIWALFLNPLGPLNYLFVTGGLVENPINFLGERDTALWSLIAVNVWKAYPFYMIMILGGLQTIPPDLYAAAQVDGIPAEAGVEEGLAAAGLVRGEVHLCSLAPQHPDHALSHLGEELVNQAGGEKGRPDLWALRHRLLCSGCELQGSRGREVGQGRLGSKYYLE